MKKAIVFFLTMGIALGIMFSYFKQQNSKELLDSVDCAVNVKKKYVIDDFFPYRKNAHLNYTGAGSEYAAKDTYVDYIKGERIQIRECSSGTTLGKVYEKSNGQLRLINSSEEFYHRYNLTEEEGKTNEVIIKEPIELGTNWEVKEGVKREITAIDKEISTAAGNFNAIEITTTGKDYTVKDYYGQNFGFIKSIYKAPKMQVETVINKIEIATELEQRIKLYYPLSLENKIGFKSEDIKFNTNDKMELFFNHWLKKSPSDKAIAILGNDTKINSIKLNKKERIVTVDFSKEFLEDLKKEKEENMLQALTNTFGAYYNLDKVLISVEGKPLRDAITVKLSEAIEIK